MCVCEHIHSGSSLCDVPEFLAAARDDIKEEPLQEDSIQPSSIFSVIECNQRHYFFITALSQLSSTSRNITSLSARAAPSSRCESINQRKIKCEGRREAAARSGGLAVDSGARHRSTPLGWHLGSGGKSQEENKKQKARWGWRVCWNSLEILDWFIWFLLVFFLFVRNVSDLKQDSCF